ncbi:unnamed protein product [Discosporangium mesarthrocarpum]
MGTLNITPFLKVVLVILACGWRDFGVAAEALEPRKTLVNCTTSVSQEPLTITVHHNWSPLGAERFVSLVRGGFFTDIGFFRCVKDFIAQFGISSDQEMKAYWNDKGPIMDDKKLNLAFYRGMLSFAGSGPNSRRTQVFITLKDQHSLGKAPWETPFGLVTSGMRSIVDKLYTGYGDQEGYNKGGVSQEKLQRYGNSYLRENFPRLSYIERCWVVETEDSDGKPPVITSTLRGKSGQIEDTVVLAPGVADSGEGEDEPGLTVPIPFLFVGAIILTSVIVGFLVSQGRKSRKHKC